MQWPAAWSCRDLRIHFANGADDIVCILLAELRVDQQAHGWLSEEMGSPSEGVHSLDEQWHAGRRLPTRNCRRNSLRLQWNTSGQRSKTGSRTLPRPRSSSAAIQNSKLWPFFTACFLEQVAWKTDANGNPLVEMKTRSRRSRTPKTASATSMRGSEA